MSDLQPLFFLGTKGGGIPGTFDRMLAHWSNQLDSEVYAVEEPVFEDISGPDDCRRNTKSYRVTIYPRPKS